MNSPRDWLDQEIPALETTRLTLRPFTLSDAPEVQRQAGHALVAATSAAIPHPYPDGEAEIWINLHREWFAQRKAIALAIIWRDRQALVGCVSLHVNLAHAKAEMGYWIGPEFWNRGYCTEAAAALIEYGFARMHLHRIMARHLETNPSSGKVLLKAGMEKEGVLREDFWKSGKFQNVSVYGVLRSDSR